MELNPSLFRLSSTYSSRPTYSRPTFDFLLRELRKKVNNDEKDEQEKQDEREKRKWFERLMQSIESDSPYGALNPIEREDVDLIVQNTNAPAHAAAKAYLRSSGDVVAAIMSLTDYS
jgi:NACalpha-BTF3-like transcription factor